MADIRQMKKKSKEVIQRGQRTPELGVVTATTWKRDTKEQTGGQTASLQVSPALISGYSPE